MKVFRKMRKLSPVSVVLAVLGVLAFGFGSRAAPRPVKVWIFFADKGSGQSDPEALREARARLSERALSRRRHDVGVGDLRLEPRYLAELSALGIRPGARSRWLNAVSAELTREQVALLRSVRFVQAVRPVARTWSVPPDVERPPGRFGWLSESGLDYGDSSNQNLLINVPAVHDLGLHGEDIVIGMLDTGFRWQEHEAFREMQVIAERDFIHADDLTRNEPEKGDSPSQDHHGTETLSAVGGFMPGRLIGPAFRASFALAKTEWVPDETHAEEDYWVEGLEWLETLGADVVSSSLGYFSGFSDGGDYSFGDLDGTTAITTRAAEMAAERGVVVVNAAGNAGLPQVPGEGTITTPADGPRVIAAGALLPSGGLAPFSSRGPTADGRTKPDVVAQGVAVVTADPSRPSAYLFLSGTSFSCPQVAGVAALLLEAHPDLTPTQVLDALRNTADRRESPDNEVGWGKVDALAAVLYYGPPGNRRR